MKVSLFLFVLTMSIIALGRSGLLFSFLRRGRSRRTVVASARAIVLSSSTSLKIERSAVLASRGIVDGEGARPQVCHSRFHKKTPPPSKRLQHTSPIVQAKKQRKADGPC
jgi:hypothetical protein